MLNLVNTIGIKEKELYIEVVRVKPQVNQLMGAYTDLLVPENDNVTKFDYGCGPSSDPALDTDKCGVYGDDEDCEDEEANDEFDEDVDDKSNRDLDVEAEGHVSSFHTFNQVLENEQKIYVSTHAASCDVSNNPDTEKPDESSPVQYHLSPSPQFEYVENFGNVILSDWTPWVKYTTGYSSGEFIAGQVLIPNLLCKRLQRFTQLMHTKSLWLLHLQKKC